VNQKYVKKKNSQNFRKKYKKTKLLKKNLKIVETLARKSKKKKLLEQKYEIA